MSKKLKSIGVMAGFTVLSRVLGLLRDQMAAFVFGTSALNSAFVTAFRIPNLFRRLLGEGSLTAAFVPTLQQELRERGRDAAFSLVSQVASWLLLVTGGLSLLAMLACSQSRLLAGHEARWYISADLSVILFPYMVFICLAAVFSATLNVLQRFTEGAVSPVLLNLCMIGSLGGAGLHWASTPMGQMYWLCAGVLAGGLLQLLLPAVALAREGWRPRFDLRWTPGVREIAVMMLPGLWGAATYQINQYIIQFMAMSIDDSAASLLFYAGRLMELPIGVFAIAISTVVYPLLAKHASEGDMGSMASDYLKGVRLILMINIPAAVGLGLLCTPIVRVLFQRGHFTAADTAAMAPLLAISVLGLPFFSVVSLTSRCFYSVKDTRTPVKVSTLSFAANLIAALLLMKPFGVAGLVMASTLAVIVQSVALQVMLSRKLPEMRLGRLARDIGVIFLAAAVMGGGVWLGWTFLCSGRGLRGDLLALCGLVPAAVLLYALMLWVLKVGGLEEFTEMWARFRTKIGLSKS